jgi:hypothetical protein
LETKYGITICNDCARCHYNIATQLSLPVDTIKSLHFNSLTLSDVMVLKCNGNAKHNSKMESNIPNNIWKPTPPSTMDDKTSFIKSKYIEKSFSSGNPSAHSEYRRSIYFYFFFLFIEFLIIHNNNLMVIMMVFR